MFFTEIKDLNNIILDYFHQLNFTCKYNNLLDDLKYNFNVVKFSNPKYNINILESIKFNYKISY